MKKTKMKILISLILSGCMLTFFESCDNKELKGQLAAANSMKDSLQGVVNSYKDVAELFGPLSKIKPAHLKQLDETVAKDYIDRYVKSAKKEVTAEAIPYSYAAWLILNYPFKKSIALHIGQLPTVGPKKEVCYITVYVVVTAKDQYKYFVDDRDETCPPPVVASEGTDDDHIPPCTPTSCPCRYYAKPCTP